MLIFFAFFLFPTDVCALDCVLGGSEAEANVLVPSSAAFAHFGALGSLGFLVDENVRLLLICTLRLHGQFGRHVCWFEGRVVVGYEIRVFVRGLRVWRFSLNFLGASTRVPCLGVPYSLFALRGAIC